MRIRFGLQRLRIKTGIWVKENMKNMSRRVDEQMKNNLFIHSSFCSFNHSLINPSAH
jgi:hypothetical protein